MFNILAIATHPDHPGRLLAGLKSEKAESEKEGFEKEES
jgi:hypothetical protein